MKNSGEPGAVSMFGKSRYILLLYSSSQVTAIQQSIAGGETIIIRRRCRHHRYHYPLTSDRDVVRVSSEYFILLLTYIYITWQYEFTIV